MKTVTLIFLACAGGLGVIVALQRFVNRRRTNLASPSWLNEHAYDRDGDPHPW